MDATEQLLKTLTETQAVPDDEEPMRRVMREYLSPLGEIEVSQVSGSRTREML